MGVSRPLILSILVYAACLPAECRSAPIGSSSVSSGGGLVCPNLNDKAVEDCVDRYAKAEGDRLTPKYTGLVEVASTACFELPGPAIGSCLDKAQEAADRALERVLKAAMVSIDGSTDMPAGASAWKGQLNEAQKRWAAFRDADCGGLVDSEYMNGTGAGLAGVQCTLSKTMMRVEEIRYRYVSR